ncbi:MAG: HNH endonuclease [Candidatus Bathyarchaeia archaeon]
MTESRKTWSPEEIQAVWEKGTAVRENHPSLFRKDQYGAWIQRDHYGNRDAGYGWEIHHIDGNPNNNGLSNLAPLQWENNASGRCVVTSSGGMNVHSG